MVLIVPIEVERKPSSGIGRIQAYLRSKPSIPLFVFLSGPERIRLTGKNGTGFVL